MVARRDSNGSAGLSVDTVDMVPIAGDDIPIVLHGCSGPMGVSLEKLLAAGHFSDLDMGHDEECCRRESSEECIFNISGNF